MVCDPSKGAPHTVAAWFNVDCFAQPGGSVNPNLYIPGTAPAYLDNVRTRGARNLDLSVYKTINFTETKALRFDISGYNMTNFAQYGYPNVPSVVTAAQPGQNFGLISNNVNTPRQYPVRSEVQLLRNCREENRRCLCRDSRHRLSRDGEAERAEDETES